MACQLVPHALVTPAEVQQYLNTSPLAQDIDDAIQVSGTEAAGVIQVTSTGIGYATTSEAGTLTFAAYPTLTAISAALDGIDGLSAVLIAPGDRSSSLLRETGQVDVTSAPFVIQYVDDCNTIMFINFASDRVVADLGFVPLLGDYEEFVDARSSRLVTRVSPLTNVYEVRPGLEAIIEVQNRFDGGVQASAEVTKEAVVLRQIGGSPSNNIHTLDFVTNTTVQDIVDAINVLSADGWSARLMLSKAGEVLSTDLIRAGAKDALETAVGLDIAGDPLSEYTVDFESGIIHVHNWTRKETLYFGGPYYGFWTGQHSMVSDSMYTNHPTFKYHRSKTRYHIKYRGGLAVEDVNWPTIQWVTLEDIRELQLLRTSQASILESEKLGDLEKKFRNGAGNRLSQNLSNRLSHLRKRYF